MWESIVCVIVVVVLLFMQFKLIRTSHPASVVSASAAGSVESYTPMTTMTTMTARDAERAVDETAEEADAEAVDAITEAVDAAQGAADAALGATSLLSATHVTCQSCGVRFPRGSRMQLRARHAMGRRMRDAEATGRPTSMSETVATMNRNRVTNPDANGYVRAMAIRTAEIATDTAKSDPYVRFYAKNKITDQTPLGATTNI